MVLAELRGHVALRLEQLGDRHVTRLQAFFGARQADLEVAGAESALPGDEGRASRGAALLAVPVGEERAFFGDAVDVGGLVAHHAVVVGADVPVADVVAPDHQDVRLSLGRRLRGGRHHTREGEPRGKSEREEPSCHVLITSRSRPVYQSNLAAIGPLRGGHLISRFPPNSAGSQRLAHCGADLAPTYRGLRGFGHCLLTSRAHQTAGEVRIMTATQLSFALSPHCRRPSATPGCYGQDQGQE